MSGIEGPGPGCRKPNNHQMFLTELQELVSLYFSKTEDKNRMLAILGTVFVENMVDSGVPIDLVLELLLDEVDLHKEHPLPKNNKPTLILIKDS